MNRIIDFVSGELTYEEFETMFSTDPSLWDIAQGLLTPEIMNDNAHPFWSRSNRSRLECNNYSVRGACLAFGFDEAGKVITHRMLGELVSYQYPDVVLREPPECSQADLWEKVGMEYLGGREVNPLIQEVLSRKSEDISVTKFVSAAKQELRALFHLVPRKYPRWVQEPEWPMGKSTPMGFVEQKRIGEAVQFWFEDVDTKERFMVEQFY